MFGYLGAGLGSPVMSDIRQRDQGHMTRMFLFEEWEQFLQET